MKDRTLERMYPSEGEFRCIAIKLSEPRQLFSNFDPAPFRMRELDPQAAQYILDGAKELIEHKFVKIVLHFPEPPNKDEAQDIVRAIHHYFHYRATKLKQQRHQLLRIGRRALLVGLTFMSLCSTIAWSMADVTEIWLKLWREGIIILGWVAMWRPMEIFLYEWWPLLQEQRVCEKLVHIAVDIRLRVKKY